MTRKIIILYVFIVAILQAIAAKNNGEVRGVWVPAPRFTDVLLSHDNVMRFVDELDSLNMNAIFLVAYAETKTIFKSKVLLKNTTYKCVEEGYLLSNYIKDYSSRTNDPLRDLINEAHARDIKVFLWFEYGFMGEGKPIAQDNPILAKNPNWIGIGNDGKAANYNKNDYYFNAYNPDVQKFLIELIKESIDLYPDIDGIQGDDRMPAMPINSGYDSATQIKYRNKFGKLPPSNFRDEQWVKWRIDILNAFGLKLYKEIKDKNKNILVSFAPNPYPWCRDNLMQDWPTWCRNGICDLLAVQCYRYDSSAYRSTIETVKENLKNIKEKPLLAPGMILSNGASYSKMTPETLRKQIEVNRELGLNGEIFFYNKGLRDKEFRTLLKSVYKNKVPFPELDN